MPKERPGEINLAPVRERVPLVAVPALAAVVGDSARLGELRQGPLFAEPAGAGIQIEFIAEREAPLLPAVRAERRRGNRVFRSADDGGNLVVEGEVFGSDLEGYAAVGTGFLHGREGRSQKSVGHCKPPSAFCPLGSVRR